MFTQRAHLLAVSKIRDMTPSTEAGAADHRLGRAAVRFGVLAARVGRWMERRVLASRQRMELAAPLRGHRDEVSFEEHVEQALSVIRQLPALRAVPGGQGRSASAGRQ
jgi:hypothetical protein